jgi:general secretion pathway protein C
MELLFRKYFWVVNLLFLLLTAYFTAKTANTFIGAAIAPKADALATAPSAPTATPTQAKVALTAEGLSKITGIPLPKVEEKTAEEEEAQAALPDLESQEPVRTGLKVRLVATAISINRPEWSMANIEDVTSHEVRVYMIGDKIQTAEVISIERQEDFLPDSEGHGRVLINNGGRKEFIDGEAGTGVVALADAHAAAPATPGAGIKETGTNSYEIPRDEINKALGNLNDIAMQARIVPAFKDGVATGFKLFSIRPDSLYTKIGIQNGDIVRRINGFEINSPDKALEVYSKLKESNRIEIEIDRNGTPMTKQYNVR